MEWRNPEVRNPILEIESVLKQAQKEWRKQPGSFHGRIINQLRFPDDAVSVFAIGHGVGAMEQRQLAANDTADLSMGGCRWRRHLAAAAGTAAGSGT